ncbi:MAG: alpha/beta fold hydrolase [Anaerolineae bacterium]|nr:alpha/beta fold hydrolase [Anaerolineae bacterium]
MIVFGVVWIISVWVLLVLALGFAATIPLMRRRAPDETDHPANYGLPCREVQFPSRDGLTLGGWWISADGPALGTVIMCSGQNGSMDKDVPQAIPLHRAGFNVLMFDFRGHGRSEGEIVTLGALEQADLFGALDYVQAEHGVDRVGLLGFSMGAGVTLLIAAQDARIAALVVDGAYPRLDGILAGYLRLKGVPGPLARLGARLVLIMGSLRTGYQLYRANPVDLIERITAPALFIHGDQDPFVSAAESERLTAQVSGPADRWHVAGAGHREAYKNHPDEYNRRVVEWFETFVPRKDR